jgi:HPr kinase/phosphorylase
MSQHSDKSGPILIHATSVALGPRAVLIRGPSGSGKSDLALRFLSSQGALPGNDQPRRLIADDQTELCREGNVLIARCPAAIAGKIEVRGVGIIPVTTMLNSAIIALIVDLVSSPANVPRLPLKTQSETLLGVTIPKLPLYPFAASAPLKLALALALAE